MIRLLKFKRKQKNQSIFPWDRWQHQVVIILLHPADKIFASPETLTGSLGVIMQGINYAGLAEKYGVKFETIKSGEFKDIMSPAREMTEEERNIFKR